MSHHIIHIFKHGSVLLKEKGFLICRGSDNSENRIPHEDVMAVIIAAQGITLTSNFVSAVLESDGIILHCNENYRPCGITTPLSRIVETRAFLNQAERPTKLNNKLWQHLIRGKTVNQLKVLKKRQVSSAHLEWAVKEDTFDEGNCSSLLATLFSFNWLDCIVKGP